MSGRLCWESCSKLRYGLFDLGVEACDFDSVWSCEFGLVSANVLSSDCSVIWSSGLGSVFIVLGDWSSWCEVLGIWSGRFWLVCDDVFSAVWSLWVGSVSTVFGDWTCWSSWNGVLDVVGGDIFNGNSGSGERAKTLAGLNIDACCFKVGGLGVLLGWEIGFEIGRVWAELFL